MLNCYAGLTNASSCVADQTESTDDHSLLRNLQEHRNVLINMIDLSGDLLDYLYQYECISLYQYEICQTTISDYERKVLLVDIVLRMEDCYLKNFLKALAESGQSDLLEMLT